jgi:hypothetical protein
MSVLNTAYLTMLDLSILPDKSQDPYVNLLAQINPILEDALALPCNDGTRHNTTVLTGLPSVTWMKLYKGVPTSKAKFQSVVDTTGIMESACEVDVRLVDKIAKAEGKLQLRYEHAMAHIEALAQEAAKAIFYHDSDTDPSKPMGFAPRFNSLSAENSKQIIDAQGTGSGLTSIWLITWDRMGSHLLYLDNGKAGVERTDKGQVPKTDAAGDTYFVYREEFRWNIGLSVRNWQYVVRIANIDVDDLTIDAATGPDLIELMTTAYYRHKGRRVALGRTYWYMSTNIVMYLDYQARNQKDKNIFLTFQQTGPNAKEVLNFRGIPCRECDAILESEDEVV